MISVIIRTYNEEAWIGRCLAAVNAQRYPEFEVLVVDNESTDATRAIARERGATIVDISRDEFSYGGAINRGIEASSGDFLAILSGHCVPVNDLWLYCLRNAFSEPDIVGVYGRQEPLPDSHAFDKRDLWTTFGIESRIQRRDFFFHNANSMIRRSIWEELPFDEAIQGVEDRHWAKAVIARGYAIAYEASGSVYHHHGIHQGRDPARAERVVRVIESINGGK